MKMNGPSLVRNTRNSGESQQLIIASDDEYDSDQVVDIGLNR